jgi:hypothetical protein
MSLVPEKIIQQVLIKGFQAFNDNNKLIDVLFHNLLQEERELIKEYVNELQIDISINYPNRHLGYPACVILLKSESETEAVLGELFQNYKSVEQTEPRPYMIDELLGDATEIGPGTVGPVWGKGEVVLEPTTVVGAGDAYVDISTDETSFLDPFDNTIYLEVLEGTGAGQRIEITSIDPRNSSLPVRIEVASNFDTVLDTTSIVQISNVNDPVGSTGDAAKVYETTERIERLGSIYTTTYNLVLQAPDQDEVLWLYTMVKAMMVINREYMIKQGFMNLKMAGSDFMPRSEEQPSLVYQRAMVLDFQYSFDIYDTVKEPLVESLVLSLTVNDPDVSTVGTEVEISNTSIDIT